MTVVVTTESPLERAFRAVVEPFVLGDEPWHRSADLGGFEEPVRWAVPGLWDVSATPSERRIGPQVAELTRAVEALEDVDVAALSDGQLLAETEQVLALEQKLRVMRLRRLREVDQRKLYTEDGFHGMKGWLAHTAPDADDRDLALAEKLERRAHVDRALDAGLLSIRAARTVTDHLAQVEPHLDRPDGLVDGQPGEPLVAQIVANTVDLVCQARAGLGDDDPLLDELLRRTASIAASPTSQRDRVEQAFVLLAAHVPAKHLEAALEQQVGAILPNLLEKQQEANEQRRGASLKQRKDGAWDLKARLTPECGERLYAALSAEARRDPTNPEDTRARDAERREQAERDGVDLFTDGPPLPAWDSGRMGVRDDEPLVPRTRSRRTHDALDRLLTRYLEQGLGGTHDKVPAQITVTLSSGLVDGTPGALPARSGSGALLARSLVRRWWCDSHVTALVMSRGWKPLGVVHTGRTLRALERKASRTQHDRRCAGVDCCPGRGDPLIDLVPHHLYDHSRHGRTSIEETVWLCPTAHHDIHTGKRRLRLRGGRVVDENGVVDDG